MMNNIEQLKIKVKGSTEYKKKGKFVGGQKPKVYQGTLMDIKNSKMIASEEADFKKNVNFIHKEMVEYMVDNLTS